MLAGPADVSVIGERVAGYREALAEAGVVGDEGLIRYGRFTVESGHEMAQAMLGLAQPPTALFAANNFLAIGAARGAVYEAGLQVPEDVSVAAFDELPYTELREPFLTVAAQPTRELGSIGVRRLLDRIAEAAQAPCTTLAVRGDRAADAAHRAGVYRAAAYSLRGLRYRRPCQAKTPRSCNSQPGKISGRFVLSRRFTHSSPRISR